MAWYVRYSEISSPDKERYFGLSGVPDLDSPTHNMNLVRSRAHEFWRTILRLRTHLATPINPRIVWIEDLVLPEDEHITDVQIDRYYRKQLTPDELFKFDNHFQTCPECGEKVANSPHTTLRVRTLIKDFLAEDLPDDTNPS